MADDEDDKTVFGQSLPGAQKPQAPKPASPPPEDRTVFGQPAPPPPQSPQPPQPQQPYQPPGGRVAPTQQPGWGAQQPPQQPPAQTPWNNPGADDTWLGGGGGYSPPPQQPQPQQPYYPSQEQLYRPNTGARGPGAEIFPDIPAEEQPQQQRVAPRIPLEEALRAKGVGKGGSSNPLIAASANLLILLGRLRTGLVETNVDPLVAHVAREIDAFERNALAAGVSPQDVQDGKYVLCATADDIVQNLPGADRSEWIRGSMVARFFGERQSGVKFFEVLDQAMKAPAQRFYLLELMLTGLSLGFEGQYRAVQDGGNQLTRIRNAIYETLRRIQPRPDDDVSVHWEPVILNNRRRAGGPPVWAVAAVGVTLLAITFGVLSTLMTRGFGETRDVVLALHAGQAPISIERTAPVTEPYVAPETNQLERIRERLAPEIESGAVEVDRKNEWIFVRVGDLLQFRTGSADLETSFDELATAIANALDSEPGAIRVVGHTDSIPMSGRGQFKTNEELSLARATTVGEVMKGFVSDPSRVSVEGKGPTEPIADNATREGQARNRRVEIMIPREG